MKRSLNADIKKSEGCFLSLKKKMTLIFFPAKKIFLIRNLTISESSPPQGLSEARRGREFHDNLSVIDPPRGRPVGGGGVYRNGMGIYTISRKYLF